MKKTDILDQKRALEFLSEQVETMGFKPVLSILAERFPRRIHLVGGAVRDAFLKRSNIHDLDLIISSDSKKAAVLASKSMGGTFFCLDDELKTYRVVFREEKQEKPQDFTMDIALWTADTLEGDLINRDFSINSICCPIEAILKGPEGYAEPAFIDPCKGMDDLLSGTMRISSVDSFAQDPVRTVRLFRFAAEIGFSIDPETLESCRRFAPSLQNSAMERVRDEFARILCSSEPFQLLSTMRSAGLLKALFPESCSMGPVDFDRLPASEEEGEWISAVTEMKELCLSLGIVADPYSLSRDRAIDFILTLGKILLSLGNLDSKKLSKHLKLTRREETILIRGMALGQTFPDLFKLPSTPSTRLTRELIIWGDSREESLLAAALWWLPARDDCKVFITSIQEIMQNLDQARKLIGGREMATLDGVRGPLMGKALEIAWTGFALKAWTEVDQALDYTVRQLACEGAGN